MGYPYFHALTYLIKSKCKLYFRLLRDTIVLRLALIHFGSTLKHYSSLLLHYANIHIYVCKFVQITKEEARNQQSEEFKIVFLGDSKVGKSSIIRRFIDNDYREDLVTQSTVSFI